MGRGEGARTRERTKNIRGVKVRGGNWKGTDGGSSEEGLPDQDFQIRNRPT